MGERFVKRRFYVGGGCETEVFTWGRGSLKGGLYVEEGFVKQRVLRGGGLRKT